MFSLFTEDIRWWSSSSAARLTRVAVSINRPAGWKWVELLEGLTPAVYLKPPKVPVYLHWPLNRPSNSVHNNLCLTLLPTSTSHRILLFSHFLVIRLVDHIGHIFGLHHNEVGILDSCFDCHLLDASRCHFRSPFRSSVSQVKTN